MSDKLIFQTLDWDFRHIVDEDDDNKKYYTIQAFGKTKESKTVYLEITGFRPFFFVLLDDKLGSLKINLLIQMIKDRMTIKKIDDDGEKTYIKVPNEIVDTEIIKKYKFWGFTNNKKFKFLKLSFDSYESMKSCEYACMKPFYLYSKIPTVLKIFESNILPLLRFLHIRELNAVGWISIDKTELEPVDADINTYCDFNYKTDWNNVQKVDDMSISKFTILSYDIECTSEDGSFPCPERDGDQVIQIGMTLSAYGSDEVYEKYLLALGETSDIEGVIVKWFKTEKELLLEFPKLLNKINPDIITGYNICGFDFSYLKKRVDKLAKDDGDETFVEKFAELSRIKGVSSPWTETKLASSAMGANIIKYYKMTGRIIIDLMKVAMRDYKLSSYKLDSVASYFIRETIKKITNDTQKKQFKIITKGTFGLVLDGYITVGYSDGAVEDIYNGGEKFRIIELGKDYIICDGNVEIEQYIDKKNYKVFWSQAKDDIKPNDIFRLIKGTPDDRAIIGKYCIQDCVLCNKLMTKLQILTNNIGMSNVCHVPLSFLFLRGQGVKIFSLVAKKCRQKDYIIPVIKKPHTTDDDTKKKTKSKSKKKKPKYIIGDELNEKQLESHMFNINNKGRENEVDDEDEGYEGAIVFVPKPDVYYEPIPVLDYASLYPNAMRLRNLSHECLVDNPEYDNLPDYKYHTISYTKNNGEIVVCRFAEHKSGKKGIIPEILTDLLVARKVYKKKMENEKDPFMHSILDGLQQAYKITANSLYGQTGASTSSICMKEIAASTTATGREMLQFSKYFIENVYSKLINASLTSFEEYKKQFYDTFKYYPTTMQVDVEDEEMIKMKEIPKMTIHVNTEENELIPDSKFSKDKIDYSVQIEKQESFTSESWTNVLKSVQTISPMEREKFLNTIKKYLLKDSCTSKQVHKRFPLIFQSVQIAENILIPLSFQSNDEKEKFIKNLTITINDMGYKNKDELCEKLYMSMNSVLKGHSINAKIIYGDTDSVFFCPHITNIKTNEIRQDHTALCMSIHLGIWASILITTVLPAPMAQEYEKVLYPFIIQGKKRYVGNLYEKDPYSFKEKSMGIELKRRDNASIVKTVSKGIINKILNERDTLGAFEYMREILKCIIDKKFGIEKFIISKTLKGNAMTKDERKIEKNKPKDKRIYADRSSMVHVVLADRIADRDPGNRPLSNDRIQYAFVEIDFEPKLQGERVETPEYIREHNLQLDHLFYITNQIMKPALKFLDLIIENSHALFDDYIIREKNRRNKILPISYFCNKNSSLNTCWDFGDNRDDKLESESETESETDSKSESESNYDSDV